MSEGKVMQTGTTGEQAKTKVGVQGVPETMLQTLFARAAESEKENHHIYDKKAIEIVSQLDYDFSKAESDKLMSSGVIARTIVLDRLVNDYLTKHPDAIVVNIACGLDTRCYRMKGKYQRWYNIDLPETMDIRSRFLEENGPVYQIAKSATDPSYTVDIEYHGEPVLVVIEGLTMYLKEQDVRKMQYMKSPILKELIAKGEIVTDNKLLTKPEYQYFDYLLNNSEFSDGKAIRNRYIHDSVVTDERTMTTDYYTLLKVMIMIIIKINDDCCLNEMIRKEGDFFEL